ncbi:MAG: folate-binding protein YgfZ [Candidatus Methylopumilus sp.]|nr:folate-binding protein YgfZ [Candidatus Methylopumilus sp.]
MFQPQSLIALGAHYQGDVLMHYGQPKQELQAAMQGNVMVHLSHLGLMQIEGEDSLNFLQGQLTNDMRALDGKQTQYAGYCTPKGRMLALFLAFAHAGHFHLLAPNEQMDALIKRLRMYVLRAKVQIQDKRDEIAIFGLAGPQVAGVLSDILGAGVPQQPHTMHTFEQATVLRLPSEHPMFLLFTSINQCDELMQKLLSKLTPVGKPAWDALNIQAALPQVVQATQEAFVPQMLNLDALNGISFKKGCYTGQEIVARTHYLGTVKRRMQIAHIDAALEIPPGQVISVAGSEDAIGMVVNAAPSINGGTDLLVEIRLDNLSAESLQDKPVVYQNHRLDFKPLPYSLP